ncbi:MAG: aminopeptidase, partial [Bacteroidetes bacterium]|nr:aminopeptidase [Bacteroidota bacterium]
MSQDAHSYSKPEDCVITHADFTFRIDFKNETISGTARYQIRKSPSAGKIVLDTRNLDIKGVTDSVGNPLKYKLGNTSPFLGAPLEIELNEKATAIRVEYTTTRNSEALQWLSPEQTAGKKHPFLFTQGQAILSRTWIPVQDSPGIRFTWSADVQVDAGLLPLMSGTNPTGMNPEGHYHFEMKNPVPAYLIALAVGNLEFRSLGKSTGVYAEPETIVAASYEFADMQNMLGAAESLYGKYLWERYDVIVLPPSFPFGGMENPMLTFATPTILAGDRSLTSLIAHELAHSWSGNLVTNKTWDDFWLNEGFTVYFERRIMEALYGKAYADMLAVLGYQDLKETIAELGADSEDTSLKLKLEGRDADDGMTDIAYEKGCLLLLQIESRKGREAFDSFLNNYFGHFRFTSINTETFVEYISEQLSFTPEQLTEVKRWIYAPGLPVDYVSPRSERLEKALKMASEFSSGRVPAEKIDTSQWSSHEWLYFIRNLNDSLEIDQYSELDEQFGF